MCAMGQDPSELGPSAQPPGRPAPRPSSAEAQAERRRDGLDPEPTEAFAFLYFCKAVFVCL
ncbi:protein of unknown function [Streptomyces sp. KY70]|nr:protein of unknown function [Streptomyces sp. KY70]